MAKPLDESKMDFSLAPNRFYNVDLLSLAIAFALPLLQTETLLLQVEKRNLCDCVTANLLN